MSGERGVLVVSNRLPYTFRPGPEGWTKTLSAGGLVTALDPVLRERGGTWVGWPGGTLDLDGETLSEGLPYRVEPVGLSAEEVEGFYFGFSNRALWPTFHTLVGRAEFDADDWEVYERVNARFAERVVAAHRGEPLIWVHDYQLLRCPAYLRESLPDTRVAFFLHIPFPSFDTFRILPWDRSLLRGLLSCDLVGFHTENYTRNFLDCAERLLACRVDHARGKIEYEGRTIQAATFPLGIDFQTFEARAKLAPELPRGEGQRVILGVDRLDYTKGIPERLRAFEELLTEHPELHEEVVFVQLAVPSRAEVPEYRELKRHIDEEVGRINGRYGTAGWTPIHYLYRTVSPEVLAGYYRDASVALITPLRDGMNLVAKEYVACQVAEPGVLVLSKMAGAAEGNPEALQVNPYDTRGITQALHRALVMPERERRSRLGALRQRARTHDVHAWVRAQLDAAAATSEPLSPPSEVDFAAWLRDTLTLPEVALLLDYDGTLTPIAPHPDQAQLSTHVRAILAACVAHPSISVAVISGRGLANVRQMVGLDGVIYAGNHGLEIEGPGIEALHSGHDFVARAEALAADLEALPAFAPASAAGAWVERKGPTLTLHVRGADAAADPWLEAARDVIRAAGFQPREAKAALEARPPLDWTKGSAVLHILNARYGADWSERVGVIYAGDDVTDEDAFEVLGGLGATFRVGLQRRDTAAARSLHSPATLHALLQWLVRFKQPLAPPTR